MSSCSWLQANPDMQGQTKIIDTAQPAIEDSPDWQPVWNWLELAGSGCIWLPWASSCFAECAMCAACDKKSLSEEDIKRLYITPAIARKWQPGQIRMKHCFTDGRIVVSGKKASRGRRKRADYLLSYQNNLPLAIVEAKDNNAPVGAGLQQALEYAEILDLPFAYSSNGDAFIERDRHNGAERELALAHFPTPDELWQRYRQMRNLSASEEKIVTEPYFYQPGDYAPRYYQRIAINRAIEAASKGQERILLAMATGTGKTYAAFQIAWCTSQLAVAPHKCNKYHLLNPSPGRSWRDAYKQKETCAHGPPAEASSKSFARLP